MKITLDMAEIETALLGYLNRHGLVLAHERIQITDVFFKDLMIVGEYVLRDGVLTGTFNEMTLASKDE